jgi:hypothetical protein
VPSEPVQVLLEVAALLDRLGIPYLVGGSMASSMLGEPRATVDVDLAVRLRAEQVESLVRALEPEFYVDALAVGEAVRRGSSFNAIHQRTVLKVDFFVLGSGGFDAMQEERRRPATVSEEPPRRVWVSSPEDLILRKLDWYRAGGCVSDRQWRDVLGVLKVQSRRLDLAYLRQWGERLGLSDLLRRAIEEAGIDGSR